MRLLCVLVCLMSSCFASDDLPKNPNVCRRMLSFNDLQAQVRANGSILPDEKLKEAYAQLMEMLNGQCGPAPTDFEQKVVVIVHNQPPQNAR